ncbi:MAG TPA: ATP-binding protein [Gemmatimonadaceae bacterium]|nr:ATP-binding protein [Gemmatimonadaceae bacterium]
MSYEEQIRAQNPWWVTSTWSDPDLRALDRAAFRWEPPALAAIPMKFGAVHTLRGPRQVGKTTTVKRLIRRLLGAGAQRVLYYSFDLHEEYQAIPEVITAAKQLRRDSQGPWYLFLDEVTSVREWQRGLKYAWDRGMIREDCTLVTGSSAHDVRRGAEQLPGRRGDGDDFLQLPMSFRDFWLAVQPSVQEEPQRIDLPEDTVIVDEFLTPHGRRVCDALFLRFETLERALLAYQRVGGFPAAVRDYLTQTDEQVSARTLRLVWNAIAGDIAKAGRDATAAVKLLEATGISLGSPLKWVNAADAMGVASQSTAKEYMEYLAESFALLGVYYWDLAGGGLSPRRQRKVYFMDPLFGLIAPALIPGARRPPDDGVAENLVATALFRSAARALVQADAVPGAVAYWRSSNDRELDFVVPRTRGKRGHHGRIPIEVKGDAEARISQARLAIQRAFGEGVVVSRTKYAWASDVPTIPLAVFLAALREVPQREGLLV